MATALVATGLVAVLLAYGAGWAFIACSGICVYFRVGPPGIAG